MSSNGGRHILQELGFGVRKVADELHGAASITPEMHVPGTRRLRVSILATWVDTLSGLLAAQSMGPRVPVTVELDVQLFHPAPESGTVRAVGRVVRIGRSLFVAGVEFACGDDEPFAVGAASFMVAPDPSLRLPPLSLDGMAGDVSLAVPLAERAQCERRGPGVAVLARTVDGLNASNTVNGGLITLAVEEAALSAVPGGTLCALGVRYLQPVRFGPVVATAQVREGLGQVEVRDEGNDNRLSVIATTRMFPDAP